ncbi:YcxB family protein [Saccharothrix saharensis]|uniref:YcxB family protein n=1 Tax=Saccharothrix saharensis TaxID=571190 RepID=UPI0036C4DC63
MEFSIDVPYDEQRMRRSLRFVLRRPVKKLRVAGVAMLALGVLLVFLSGPTVTSVAVLVLGLVYVLAMEPILLWQSTRAQNPAVRQDYRLTVDEAGFGMKAEGYEQRMAWSTVQRVEEEPDAWILVLSKIQAAVVYKDLMTEEQRRTFVAILAQRVPA